MMAEGRAMRNALSADFAAAGVRVFIELDRSLPDEPGPWEILRRPDPGWAELDDVVVIAPEEPTLLGHRADCVQDTSFRLISSLPEAIKLAGDKSRLGPHLRRHGVVTPECLTIDLMDHAFKVLPEDFSISDFSNFFATFDPSGLLPGDFPYPAVLKPQVGAGSIDTFYLPHPGACPVDLRSLGQMLLQPYIPGEPMSASFLVGADGRSHLVGVGRQRIEIREDVRIVYRGGVVPAGPDPSCDEARRAVAAVPGLRGLVGIDFIRDPATGRDTIIEINPRPTTSVVGLCRLLPPGALAAAWLAAVDGTLSESVDLAALVHAQRPIAFEPDGTIFPLSARDL
jgi:predicted ATP-grasp superfamily ATP-dependent carboligase